MHLTGRGLSTPPTTTPGPRLYSLNGVLHIQCLSLQLTAYFQNLIQNMGPVTIPNAQGILHSHMPYAIDR